MHIPTCILTGIWYLTIADLFVVLCLVLAVNTGVVVGKPGQGQLELTLQAFRICFYKRPKSEYFRFCGPRDKTRIFCEHTNVPTETFDKHP